MLTEYFEKKEVTLLLPYVRDSIVVGSFSYLVYRVINLIDGVHNILKDLVFSLDIEQDERNHLFWFYLNISKFYSKEETLQTVDEYLKKYPFGGDEAIEGTIESIKAGELWLLGG